LSEIAQLVNAGELETNAISVPSLLQLFGDENRQVNNQENPHNRPNPHSGHHHTDPFLPWVIVSGASGARHQPRSVLPPIAKSSLNIDQQPGACNLNGFAQTGHGATPVPGNVIH
jgi:hypothetical protein